ncbi:MAG: hypothetical protein KDK39_10685 [Leptospiraceae bacterium]|nr:hypothetical protein [Leptospiraceae bacterium]
MLHHPIADQKINSASLVYLDRPGSAAISKAFYNQIPQPWHVAAHSIFSELPLIRRVGLVFIRPRGESWRQSAWQAQTRRWPLLLLEIDGFIPSSKLRSQMLLAKRVFTNATDNPLYFRVIATSSCGPLLQRLYPQTASISELWQASRLLYECEPVSLAQSA